MIEIEHETSVLMFDGFLRVARVNRCNASTPQTNETESYHLPRRDFLLVFLGPARVGGIKKALRGSGGFCLEDRGDGRVGFPEIDRASGVVLWSQLGEYVVWG